MKINRRLVYSLFKHIRTNT